MSKNKTAILLMNVGSPDKPEKNAVKKYLSEFLNDRRVIDLPWLLQKILVNLIIIPFRVKKSTKLYKRLWTPKGSPLIYYTEELKEKLQQRIGNEYEVFVGMRYGNPGYKKALSEIKDQGFSRLVIMPLFPQHAMSTTETAIVAVEKEIEKQKISVEILKIDQFYNHPSFINAFTAQAKKYNPESYDHIVFSYHGLPNRQIEKCHPGISVESCSCTSKIPDHGKYCYRATCFATTRLLAKNLKLKPEKYTTSFQSRLTKNWLSPFSDEVLLVKLREGNKRILVLAPSFVTDCLETIIEISDDYSRLFKEKGGEKLQLVESLNTEIAWIDALKDILLNSLQKK